MTTVRVEKTKVGCCNAIAVELRQLIYKEFDHF